MNGHIIWQSDWMGYEVGFDDNEIVSLFSIAGTNVYFYVDADTNELLDIWKEEE